MLLRNCLISFMDSALSFYVQEADFDERIAQLQPDIDKCAAAHGTASADTRQGQPLICRFSDDQLLYRCQRVDVDDDEGDDPKWPRVLFVDYGNVDRVSTAELWPMSTALLSTPAHAIHCSLTFDMDKASPVYKHLEELVNDEARFDVLFDEAAQLAAFRRPLGTTAQIPTQCTVRLYEKASGDEITPHWSPTTTTPPNDSGYHDDTQQTTTTPTKPTLAAIGARKLSTLSKYLGVYASFCRLKYPPSCCSAIRARFECKYDGLTLPIGVRPLGGGGGATQADRLAVCDMHENCVHVYEVSTGKRVHTISDKSEAYAKHLRLVRPSALVVDEAEMFVKDDKEILVFELASGHYRFVRKFGAATLTHPYGLALDAGNTSKHILVVDENLKMPAVYTFDKHSGSVVNTAVFNPLVSAFSRPDTLRRQFGAHFRGATSIGQFDRCKVRFMWRTRDALYATDLGRNLVFKTNMRGEIQMAFGCWGKENGELKEPAGIFVDEQSGAILVADSKNNRIQVKTKIDIRFL